VPPSTPSSSRRRAILSPTTPSEGFPPSSRGSNDGVRVSRAELVRLLAPALGEERSLDVVVAYGTKVGANGPDFTRAQAARMLELMSASEGILGVVASFARARFILKFPG